MKTLNTLKLVAIRGENFVVLSGAVFDTPERARMAFDSVPAAAQGTHAAVLDLCDSTGSVHEDKLISALSVEEILADVDPRPFAEILATAPLLGGAAAEQWHTDTSAQTRTEADDSPDLQGDGPKAEASP